MCGHSHRHPKPSLRHGDPLHSMRDPTSDVDLAPDRAGVAGAPSARPDLRTSDAERESAALLLRDHAGQGRLDVDELSDRLDRVYASRTRGELDAELADLPSLSASRPPVGASRGGDQVSGRRHVSARAPRDRDPEGLASHLAAYVGVCLLLVGIWFVTGADYFWPMWPILGWGIGVASHAVPVLTGTRSGTCGSARLTTSAGSSA